MKKKKILVDLKPALDGFSGIPAESRLLFYGLNCLPDKFDVEGLLQHSNQMLHAKEWSEFSKIDYHEKVLTSAQTVASFCQPPYQTSGLNLYRKFKLYIALQTLKWNAWRGSDIKLGVFETQLFADFLWARVFSKTLPLEAKKFVTDCVFKVLCSPRNLFHLSGIPKFVPGLGARFAQLDTEDYDVVVAQTPFPARVSKNTKLVIRYHDAFPLLMPHTIHSKGLHIASHYYALVDNVNSGALFVCNSEATKSDLLTIFPELENTSRVSVIYNIVSDDYFEEEVDRKQVSQIINSRLSIDFHGDYQKNLHLNGDKDSFDYLLMVSTLEPRKNHQLLISAWEQLRLEGQSGLKLILVGNVGWDCDEIVEMIKPWQRQGDVLHLMNVPPCDLRVLYRCAKATICPSFAEGFDYTGVEAMKCGGTVVASNIPVHKEVFGKAAVYFDPYSISEAVGVIGSAINGVLYEQHSAQQVVKDRADQYSLSSILPDWQDYLSDL